VNVNIKDNRRVTAIDIVRKRGNEEKRNWESEEECQKRKRDCSKIIELLESFERNPIETRFKLRVQLGFPGKSFKKKFLYQILSNLSKILFYISRQGCCFYLFNDNSAFRLLFRFQNKTKELKIHSKSNMGYRSSFIFRIIS